MDVKQGFDYDDVILEPKNTTMESRSEIVVTDHQGMYPIFTSPMKWISGYNLVRACGDAKIYGILHRFDDYSDRIKAIDALGNEPNTVFGVAVGLDTVSIAIANHAWEHGADYICVDVANGHLSKVGNFVERLRSYGISKIVAGNVATREGADVLYESGALFIRVGIGGGSLCTTRNVTGVGVPDLTAIENVALSRYSNDFYIVADGGIRNSGNAVKAFAVGADYVMLGSYVAQAFESDRPDDQEEIHGMASAVLQMSMDKPILSVEGISKTVKKIAPLHTLIDTFMGGIRSACTYLNSPSYRDIKYNAEFYTTGKGSLKQL